MHALLISVGSAGDLYPMISVGRALRARGHRVSVGTHGYYEPVLRKAGLEYVELATAEDFLVITREARLAHLRVAASRILQVLVPAIRRVYRVIEERLGGGDLVVAASPLAFGARIAQEHLGVPLATIHVSPAYLRTEFESPHLRTRLAPRVVKRIAHRGVEWLTDRRLGPELNRFRDELGLQPIRRITNDWWNSPDRILALFPGWLFPPQPDWPKQTVLTGCPAAPGPPLIESPPEATAFLAGGDPPIVFTTASWMRHVSSFFHESAEACARLGCRGVFLTPFREQVPANLPKGVTHFPELPYGWLLERAQALVHHAGVGTAAAGLAAGVPQLTTPMILDQPYTAARLVQLGVADAIPPRRYRGRTVASALGRLIESSAVASRCRELAARSRAVCAAEDAADRLEELGTASGCDGRLPR